MSVLVLIAGVSGSGKTTLARRITDHYPTALLSIDDYYRGFEDVLLEQPRLLNFDSPTAIEDSLIADHLARLLQGETIARPVYDHAAFVRHAETMAIAPAPLILLEGLFALAWEPIRNMASLRVFVDTDEPICFRRRLHRDLEEFHRTSEDALLRYHTHVRPNQERYVIPTRTYADLIVSTGAEDDAAYASIATWLDKNLQESA
jgi:uridine kinase